MFEIDLQGHGKLWRHKAETLKAKGRGELEGKRASRVGEKQDMAATRGMNPFLKADFPARALKRHGQGLPQCAPGFPSYDTGARPHMSYKLARSAKKVNRRTRSVQLPRGCVPLHLRRNQRSRGRTAAQGVCNRPAVVHPLGFAATSGPTSSMRAQAHMSCTWRWFLRTEKSHRHSRQYHTSSGPPQKTEKLYFQNQCSDSRHPAHGPTKPLSAEVTG
jgi:hypothetical protein